MITSTPWHTASFDRFLHEGLPHLLATQLPLTGYRVTTISPATCSLHVVVASADGELTTTYDDIPYPDPDGVFIVEHQQRVVLPLATHQDLVTAEIHCVGEQLLEYLTARLGPAPAQFPWDAALLRLWLPLDEWLRAFFLTHPSVEQLHTTNWLATQTHLRRLRMIAGDQVIEPSYFGRICPIDTPEGSEAGRLLSLAMGATIRDGRLLIVDERPEQILGLAASTIPFLEHSTVARLLMGANLLRDWLPPPDPEPALVRTGNEPDTMDFWCGRNLLTAFTSWGADTFEDAIVLSESCACRLAYPYPVEPGDKLSNRHGAKGVVSRIVPDAEMPYLPDGTPVELIYPQTGLISRLNFGQVREALMGRITHAEHSPAIIPPFHAPSAEELHARCLRAGLRQDGMETLTLGVDGPALARPSTVGWVYWGRTTHTARAALRVTTIGGAGQHQDELAYVELRDASAFENIREHWNTRAAERADTEMLAVRVAAGPVEQSPLPTPQFATLVERLAAAGVRAELTLPDQRLRFRLDPPTDKALTLATPVLHPWLRGWSSTGWSPAYQLTRVGAWPPLTEYHALVASNGRLERLLADAAPTSLRQQALADLDTRIGAYFDALLTLGHLHFDAHVRWSGRAVIAPGTDLRLDQVGLPDELAWTLFGPLVERELDAAAIAARTAEATQALEALMAHSWVLIYHGGDIHPFYATVDAPFLAFHPVRSPDRVVRLHPQACNIMDADFDGDEVEIFLPLTAAGQTEAGARLSVAGTITRLPQLLKRLGPAQLAIWGLADLSLTASGQAEINILAGTEVARPHGFVDKQAVATAIEQVFEREGFVAAAEAIERLARRGFEASRTSGASMSPFFGESFTVPSPPESDDPALWYAYTGEVHELMRTHTHVTDPDMGVQILSTWSGARGNVHLIAQHIAPVGLQAVTGRFPPLIVRHSYCTGLTPQDLFAVAVAYWMAWTDTGTFSEQLHPTGHWVSGAEGFRVLARARRSPTPGIVFARAAVTGEDDPLTNIDSRLFVGLPVPASKPE
ncbi:MAG: hypothetical protein H0X37_09270 [Herpetosiphonaceae bacterium]|nr:hypothetical protein [Herpetosiphonaceae bacterium]